MRIKEKIKRSGDFSLPSSPQREISGTLSISDGGTVKLEFTQPEYTNIPALFGDNSKGYRILGHVEKDVPVMIDKCYKITEARSMAHGRWKSCHVIWANRAFIGFPYNEDTEPLFNAVTFSVEGIDEWVRISGIEVDDQSENSALTISYNKPADISLNLENGMQLLITFAWTPPGLPATKRAEVTQKTYFRLISQEARELDQFTSTAQKITAFLCFVMNEIVCMDRMRATADNLRQNIPVEIYCSSWPYAKDEPEINELDILFKYEDIQDCAENLINKWLANYGQIAPALDLYFLTKTGTLPSWNMHFLTLVQAVEAYHRRTSGERCMVLRNRIEKMTEPFDSFMGGENRPGLIDSIMKTRNYLTHYDSKSEAKAAKGRVLEFLCVKMNALFRLHFLKLIGFNEQEIDAIVDKCSYLKGECNLWRM